MKVFNQENIKKISSQAFTVVVNRTNYNQKHTDIYPHKIKNDCYNSVNWSKSASSFFFF